MQHSSFDDKVIGGKRDIRTFLWNFSKVYHNPHCTLVAGKLKSSGSLSRSSAVHSVTQLVVGNWTETKVDRNHCVLSLKNYSQFTLNRTEIDKNFQCALYSLLKITLSLCDISYVYRICTGIISVVVVTSKRKDYSLNLTVATITWNHPML